MNYSTTSIIECLTPFLDVAYGPKPPHYSYVEIFRQFTLPRLTRINRQILKLDRTMRDYPLPELPAADDVPLSNGMRITAMLMRSFSTMGLREIGRPCYDASVLHTHYFWIATALLYLHRTYLVETLIRWPEDPLTSKFALSVLAAHRSSLLIIQGLSRLHGQLTELVPRITFLYLHAFSAYVRTILISRLHSY